MNKKIFVVSIIILIIITLLFVGCDTGQGVKEKDTNRDPGLQVITSISILADIANNIVGDAGNVQYIVPKGDKPEEYEPIPSDFQKVNDASVFFVNGLGIEGWLNRILNNVTNTTVVHLTVGGPTIPLVGQKADDPHLWFNVRHVINYYVPNIVETLVDIDPERADVYYENAKVYIAKLEELDTWIREQVQKIDEQYRVIVISENAFKYFGEAYGFETEGIWELNSHQEGTPQQISRVVELVNKRKVPSLFVESTVDRRYMETVSRETGAPIAGIVYTDAIGSDGSDADTYIKMMKHNVSMFIKGLS